MSDTKIPTLAEKEAAEEYALSKLCTEIPGKFGAGYTMWDDRSKTCKITQKGCQATPSNPISQLPFDGAGNVISFDKNNRVFGWFWKKFPADYLIWRATKTSGGRAVCAKGNELLYQWCMYPNTRGDGDHIKGITNVPRFQYNVRNGREECYIPKSYCDNRGVSYNETTRDCYVSAAQKAKEFFVGSVITRRANRASDTRLKKNIELYHQDFLPGLNVYTYEWNDLAATTYGYVGGDVGFLADEFPEEYVGTDDLGFKYIKTDIEDDFMIRVRAFLIIVEQLKNKMYTY
jgi:hypothetical protein